MLALAIRRQRDSRGEPGIFEQRRVSARALRTHLEICPGCRQYLAEMSRLVGQIASAAPADHLPASETFHRQVMLKIKAEASTPFWQTIMAFLRPAAINWHVALPATAVIVALLLAGIELRPQLHPPVNIRPPTQVALPPVSAGAINPAPTIANYQQVAGQSLEKLDDLLAREGEQTGAPAPAYTAASMSLRF